MEIVEATWMREFFRLLYTSGFLEIKDIGHTVVIVFAVLSSLRLLGCEFPWLGFMNG